MNIISSIVPFDMLVDTDMGIIKYVQVAYQGSELYYPGIMEMVDAEFTDILKTICIHRKFSNPLSAIVKSEKLLLCKPDDMVDSFFYSAYDTILKLSTNTAIFDVVCKSLFLQEALKFTVLCKSEKEKEELLRRMRKVYNTEIIPLSILVDERKNVDINDFGNFYLKDIHEIEEFKGDIEGSNIIIGNYDFNKEYDTEKKEYIDLPLMDVINKYTDCNEISFIDIYPLTIEQSSVG